MAARPNRHAPPPQRQRHQTVIPAASKYATAVVRHPSPKDQSDTPVRPRFPDRSNCLPLRNSHPNDAQVHPQSTSAQTFLNPPVRPQPIFCQNSCRLCLVHKLSTAHSLVMKRSRNTDSRLKKMEYRRHPSQTKLGEASAATGRHLPRRWA